MALLKYKVFIEIKESGNANNVQELTEDFLEFVNNNDFMVDHSVFTFDNAFSGELAGACITFKFHPLTREKVISQVNGFFDTKLFMNCTYDDLIE